MALRLMKFFKEPLFHFLILGTGLFYAYSLLNTQHANTPEHEIVVNKAKVVQLSKQFESQHKRPPLTAELNGLINEFIREEIIVREAKKLTLDQNDSVIRRRLLQKMAFLNASFLSNLHPKDGELEMFYENNIETYSSMEKLAFEQVFLGKETPKNEQLQILKHLNNGKDLSKLLSPTFLPADVALSEQSDIERIFGSGFFNQLRTLENDKWRGPVESAYGSHFIRIFARQTSAPIAFDEIKEKVEQDWRDYRGKEIIEEQYNKLKSQYEISRPILVEMGALEQ